MRYAIILKFTFIFLLVVVPLYLVILWHNWNILVSDIVPYGDNALDMLLIERVQHDWLLTGHYSRFEFNHPGPFFLYARHFSGLLFGNALPSPYGAQLIGIIAVNVLFIGFAASTAAAFVGPDWKVTIVAALATIVVILIQDNGVGMLAHPWMPHVLVAPFFAFVLLLAGTAQGRLWMLPVASLCGSALVHGYAPLLVFVGLPWPLALAAGLIQHRRSNPQAPALPRGPLVVSAAIIALFVAPIILDMVINPPGNIATILAVSRTLAPISGSPLNEVAAFVIQFWQSISPILWILATFGIVAAWWDLETRAAILYVIAIVGLMTLLVTLYAWRAPGPLFSFIARFYLGAPLAVMTIAVVSGVKIAMRWAPWSVSLAVAMTGIALVFNGTFISRNQNMAGIRELSNGVLDNLGDKAREGARISFDTHEYARLVAGLLLDLGRRGTPACVEAPHLAFLFTPERICTPPMAGQSYAMVAIAACAETCIVRSEQLGVGLQWLRLDPVGPGELRPADPAEQRSNR
jgi:hypothetical protein